MVRVSSINKSFTVRPDKKGRLGLGGLAARAAKGGKSVHHVLKDVSFTASEGAIYGLLGPNGAGKTTTLRCIATLLRPDSGTIEVEGLDTIHDSKQVRASVGFLTSDMKMSGNLSPRELLEFFGRLNHLSDFDIARRTGELATYLAMQDCLDTPVEKCSTGQKQKCSLAVSLIHDPRVIIFDEPTNGLDILAAKTVVDFLRDYRSRGKTVILSTHIMSEAETLCDTIGIMLDGRIVDEGSLSDLCARHEREDLGSVFFKIAGENGALSRA